MKGCIPLTVPHLSGQEWAYVKECLDTAWVSSAGPFVERFERETAGYLGIGHAVAMVNGTAGLHLALIIAGVEPNDEVLVSTLTFIAPVNAIRYVGAWPVFIDAEPGHGQMDPELVCEFLSHACNCKGGDLYNKVSGRRVRAIVPVHILGHPVDMDPILEIARRYDLVVIEDAAESLGARYKGRAVGTLGDLSVLSFNGNKLITTGGGGMLITDRHDWAERARYLSKQAKDDPIEYVHREVGYNYRLTNIQAALGCAQLEQIDAFIEAKRRIAGGYAQALDAVPGLRMLPEAPWAQSTFWLAALRVDENIFGLDRRALMEALKAQGIQTRPFWQPVHHNPPYRGLSSGSFPVAERLQQQALCLPCSVGLATADQQRVIEAVMVCSG